MAPGLIQGLIPGLISGMILGLNPGADASQSVIRKVVWWVVGGGTVNLTSAPGLVQVFVIF